MLSIVLFLIVIFILVNQSSRIARLERELKKPSSATSPAPSQKAAKAESSADIAGEPGSYASDSALRATASVETPSSVSTSTPAESVGGEETSGRILGGIGIAAVVIGVSFFLKYAFDNNWVGPTGRVMIGIIAGIILLGIGQYIRKKYLRYSDLLMGGGIAVLYLSMFAAHFYYHLVSPLSAFAFMVIITILAFAISIANATPVLAMVSTIGGFVTPILANPGMESMFPLFGYLTILNIGILAISFFKKWPYLLLAALIGTLTNFSLWFGLAYSQDKMGSVLAFCFITFLIFLVGSVARAVVAKASADPLNYFVIGFNAVFLASMGYVLLQPSYEYILGYAAVFVAAVFFVVALIVNKFNPEDRALNIFMPGLSVTFLSLAIPLQLSGPWVPAAWLVEAAALYLVASFISNRGFQVMGAVVYALGAIGLVFYTFPRSYMKDFTPIFNVTFMVFVIAVASAYAIAYMYRRYGSISVEIQKRGIAVFIIVANILTLTALTAQITKYHSMKIAKANAEYEQDAGQARLYSNGYDTSGLMSQIEKTRSEKMSSIRNRSNTYVSIMWVLYAALLTAIGFGSRQAAARRLGLILFLITAIKVVMDVWSLGQLYRIVSFIVFGVIALAASFAYVKYRDRLKEIV